MSPARVPWPLWIIFFASGTASLAYQILWTRHAMLTLGSSIAAIGTVVATFLFGLATGAALGGRWIDRRLATRPPASALALYAALELGIAAYGVLFAPLLEALAPLLGVLYRSHGELGGLFNLARILLTAVLILPPTLAMGATLPVLSRFIAALGGETTRAIGLLYGLNTLGAVAGCALSGWIFLPRFGMATTTLSAAGLNVIIALGALFLRRRQVVTPETPLPTDRHEAPQWIFPAYACAGFAALMLEIAWTRSFILAFGSSIHAFSLVLSCFIFGIGLGSSLMARTAERVRHPAVLFAVLQFAVAVWTIGSWMWPLQSLPYAMVNVYGSVATYGELAMTQLAFAAVVIIPPTALLGAQWPVLCRLALGNVHHTGAAVGRLYAWNTTGNILGTLVVTFLVLPLGGIVSAVRIAAGIGCATAGLALWHAGPWRRWTVLPAGGVLAAFLIPSWDPIAATVGPASRGRYYLEQSSAHHVELSRIVRDQGNVVFERWDSFGLVTVQERRNFAYLTLRVNGKVDASTGADMITQALTAHVPLLLHPNPKQVLVVGLASGATLDAALKHPIAHADCVEISPAVVEAHRRFFHERMGRPLDDPRASLIVNDVRSHLLYTKQTYDVIASEPSNLWVSGVATLFSSDHFARCRARLAPGGILCQFLHAYQLPPEDFRSVLATFREVFPQCLLWEILVGRDYLLVGLIDAADYAVFERRAQEREVERHLASVGVRSPRALHRCLIGDRGMLETLTRESRVMTDDHLSIEYSAPRGLVEDGRAQILADLSPLRTLPIDALQGAPPLTAERAARAGLAEAVRLHKLDETLAALAALKVAQSACTDDPAWEMARDEICNRAFVLAYARQHQPLDAVALLQAILPESSAAPQARDLLKKLQSR